MTMKYSGFYSLFLPAQAVGANLVYFDLFNAVGSGKEVYVHSLVPVVSGAVAVTGLVAVDLFLTKTSAVGTGGTAATTEGTSLTAATISAIDNSQPIDGNITARLTPSGGATAAGVLSHRSVYTEEANAGTYAQINDLVRGLYTDVAPLRLSPGRGLRVVQGSVASVGNIGFNVIFRTAQVGT
jgi:hypothetical protein